MCTRQGRKHFFAAALVAHRRLVLGHSPRREQQAEVLEREAARRRVDRCRSPRRRTVRRGPRCRHRQALAELRPVAERVGLTHKLVARGIQQQMRLAFEREAERALHYVGSMQHCTHCQRTPHGIGAQHENARRPLFVLGPDQERKLLAAAEHWQGMQDERRFGAWRKSSHVHVRVDRLQELRAELRRLAFKHKLDFVLGAWRAVLHHT